MLRPPALFARPKSVRLAGDTAYGAAPMLNWLVEAKGIAPHIPVFDKSKRDDGTFSRSDFRYRRSCVENGRAGASRLAAFNEMSDSPSAAADFCSKICHKLTSDRAGCIFNQLSETG